MEKVLISFVIFIFLISCSSPNVKDKDRFDKKEQITLQEIDYPEIIGIGLQLIKKDSILFISDFHGSLLINAFDLNNKKIYRSFGSRGNGPGELLSPIDIQLLNENLYILNRPMFSLNHVLLDSLIDENVSIMHDFQLPSKSDRFIPLTERLFVFSGMWGEHRYSLLNLTDESLKEFGTFPDFNEDEKGIPNEVKAIFHHCKFLKHPHKNLFLSISPYVLEKFSYEAGGNDMPKLEKRKQLGKYDYNFTDGEIISAQAKVGSDPGVKEVGCSKEHIFLVVDDIQTKGSNILVYDWDLKPVKILQCDKKISYLAIDEKGEKGYCIIENPEDTLFEFIIPSL